MKHLIYYLMMGCVIILSSCTSKKEVVKEWKLTQIITLDSVNPIGITNKGGELWLSDADHNRLVQIDTLGNIIKTINDFDRPMHIDSDEASIFVPQYGADTIAIINDKRDILPLSIKLDAPAGIAIYQKEIAIADFYNNQIHYYDGKLWNSFGDVGNANGQFYYPTDVQITQDEIWVADAYNHRVQVFNKQREFLKAIAWDQGINAATGIFVSKDEVFVTDFENDRILIFDHQGMLKQELKEDVHKPTDMLIKGHTLYTLNYRKGTVNIYKLVDRT